MPFVYSNRPHVRRHGPAGYTDYTSYKPWLRDDFHFRCVYCLERERWYPSGHAAFGVEHVQPKANPNNAAFLCDYENLVYACNRCNSVKQNRLLLDPCATALAEHVRVADDGSISGLTLEGKKLVDHLGLDRKQPRMVRQRFLRLMRLYHAQPEDPEVRALYLDYFSYPDDLPDLSTLRPETNTCQAGLAETYFRRRELGQLAETY